MVVHLVARQVASVTVNSDDPAYFGGYLAENFQSIRDHLVLTTAEIHQLTCNGFQAAFLPSETKGALLHEVDRFVGTVESAISTHAVGDR